MPTQRPNPERPAPSAGRERRRWARANADIPATIVLEGGQAHARVRDISRAGVCFYLERPIPLMTVLALTLELALPGTAPSRIGGQGAVVRCERIAKGVEHWEIAVFLHEMAEGDREAIERFVAARPTGSPA